MTTSWDDGHPLDLRLAELLHRHGLRATFYIPRSAATGTMSPPQIRDLAAAFDIGAHTLKHVDLTALDDTAAEAEIRGGKEWLQDLLGRPCSMFCPPLGHFTPRHLRMVHAAGYLGMRTVEFFSMDFPRPRAGLRIMPTTLQAHPNGAIAYARNIAKRLAWRNLWLYILHGRSTDWQKLARSLLAATLQRGGVFHLWGHSWELESSGQWQRLEEILRLMGEHRAAIPCLTNAELCSRH